MKLCDECITERTLCPECIHNPLNHYKKNHFHDYVPVCPRGYPDCVSDPAYIKKNYPVWYEQLYGNKTPLEALWVENGCMESVERDPEEKFYCYDDEDK